jgi:uncharacterized protein YjbJ (UPF0337 family)
MTMNKEQVEGKFQQLNGEIKKLWGRMTDDEITLLDGQEDSFYGKLKEKYGIAREEGEKRLKEIINKYDD